MTVSATGLFADKNVGLNKLVTITSSYSGTDVGNYTITDQTNDFANISKRGLSVKGITAIDKIYDGKTDAALNLSNLQYDTNVPGDEIIIDVRGTFDDKNAGQNKTVVLVSNFSGADAGNYDIVGQTSTTASITPRALTVGGLAAVDRINDGSTVAAIDVSKATYTGLVAGDDLRVAATGQFDTKNVGIGKLVTVSSTYSGADVRNYAITDQAIDFADVTQKALIVSGITASDKIYDATLGATVDVTGVKFTGIVAGDDLAVATTGAFADKNVGKDKRVALTSSYSGVDVGNYAITDQVSTLASIAKKTLSVGGITAVGKIYDGATFAQLDTSNVQFNGIIAGDELTVSATGRFADKNAGVDKTVFLTSNFSGVDAGNYDIGGQLTALASISAKELSVSGLLAVDKEYDGNTVVSVDTRGAVLAGLVDGDDLRITAVGQLSDRHVGNDKQVAITSSYSGLDVGNYSIVDQTDDLASVTRRASVTWTGGASGNWFDASNWAGGALPDFANVSEVIINNGATVEFSGGTAPVELEALRQNGRLQMVEGTLNLGSGGLTLNGLLQSGGAINVAGQVTLDSLVQNSGLFEAAGNVAVRYDFGQSGDGKMTIMGDADFTDNLGGIQFGDLKISGSTQVTSTGGAVSQLAGTALSFEGPLRLSAGTSAISLEAADNVLGGPVTIASASDVMLAAKGKLGVTVAGASGSVALRAAGDLNAVVNTVGSMTLTTTDGGKVTAEGSAANLTINSSGAVLLGTTKIANTLEIQGVGDILETAPWAVMVGGPAKGQSVNGKIDVRALVDGNALNTLVRPIEKVVQNAGIDAGVAGGQLAAASVTQNQPASSLITTPDVKLQPALAITTPMMDPVLTTGTTAAVTTGNTIRVTFSDVAAASAPTAEPLVQRSLPVAMSGDQGVPAFALTVAEEAGAYTVQVEKAELPATGQTSASDASVVDAAFDLNDALEFQIDDQAGESGMFAVTVSSGTLVLVLRDEKAQQAIQKQGPAVVALALAKLRKERAIGLKEITQVAVTTRF